MDLRADWREAGSEYRECQPLRPGSELVQIPDIGPERESLLYHLFQ